MLSAATATTATATATRYGCLVARGRGWRHEGRVGPLEAEVEVGLAGDVLGLETLVGQVGPGGGFEGAHLLPNLAGKYHRHRSTGTAPLRYGGRSTSTIHREKGTM